MRHELTTLQIQSVCHNGIICLVMNRFSIKVEMMRLWPVVLAIARTYGSDHQGYWSREHSIAQHYLTGRSLTIKVLDSSESHDYTSNLVEIRRLSNLSCLCKQLIRYDITHWMAAAEKCRNWISKVCRLQPSDYSLHVNAGICGEW